jgi:hypothetical protein
MHSCVCLAFIWSRPCCVDQDSLNIGRFPKGVFLCLHISDFQEMPVQALQISLLKNWPVVQTEFLVRC